jgi:hypothetical protein
MSRVHRMVNRCTLLFSLVVAIGCAKERPAEQSSALITDHVGRWTFDESEGTVAYDDERPSPHHGTFYDGEAPNEHGPERVKDGVSSGAVGFDGIDDSVRITDFSYGPAFTISFWFKVADISGGSATLLDHGSPFNKNSLTIQMAGGSAGTGEIYTYLCDTNDGDCEEGIRVENPPGGTWADGAWHHYVLAVGDWEDALIYLDGALAARGPRGGDEFEPGGPIFAGGRPDAVEWLEGVLDEVTVFNRKLLAPEALTLYEMYDWPPPPANTVILNNWFHTADDFPNPERGWYISHRDPTDGSLSDFPAGVTLGLAIINLRQAFENGPDECGPTLTDPCDVDVHAMVPETLKTNLRSAFDDLRAHGDKVIVRIKYHDEPIENPMPPPEILCLRGDPPTKELVEAHISGLQQVFEDYRDVIVLVQAGYLGVWGEFHQYCPAPLLDDVADWGHIIDHAFANRPTGRTLALRSPDRKEDFLAWKTMMMGPFGPFPAAEGFGTGYGPNLAHFNDCFLSSPSDTGTYPHGGGQTEIDMWKAYVAQESKYMPFGGETCPPDTSPPIEPHRFDCSKALPEMRQLHLSYLNMGHWDGATNPDPMVGIWANQGCRDYISRSLGYRFYLYYLSHTERVKPNDPIEVTIRLTNLGFASMFNPRPVYLILRHPTDNKKIYMANLGTAQDVDPRRWFSGEWVTFTRRVRIPNDAPSVDGYTLALWMPDEADCLKGDPRFSVRLANVGTWEDMTGFNILSNQVDVDESQPPNMLSSDVDFVDYDDSCPP